MNYGIFVQALLEPPADFVLMPNVESFAWFLLHSATSGMGLAAYTGHVQCPIPVMQLASALILKGTLTSSGFSYQPG